MLLGFRPSALVEMLALGQLGLLPGLSKHFPFKVSKPSIFHKHLTALPLFKEEGKPKMSTVYINDVSAHAAPTLASAIPCRDAEKTFGCQVTTGCVIET